MDVHACRLRLRIAAFFLASLGIGCGGEVTAQVNSGDGGNGPAPDSAGPNPAHDDAAADTGVVIGPVDFSKASTELALQCTRDVGHLAFKMPCKVGLDLGSRSQGPGIHETECSQAGANEPVIWSFLLPLAEIAQHPSAPLRFPGDLPSPPGTATAIDVGGESFMVAVVEGTLSFAQVDPPGRAFVARFEATVQWKGNRGSSFSCAVGGPLWGAPGSFL